MEMLGKEPARKIIGPYAVRAGADILSGKLGV